MVDTKDTNPGFGTALARPPRSVRLARALLVFIVLLAALSTENRLGTVAHFGTTFGSSLPLFAGLAILAFTSVGYCFATLGLFFLLEDRRRRSWWLALGLLPVAVLNAVAPIILIAEEHVGIALVLDVYLVNGLLPLAVTCLMLRRSAREFFGISRPRPHRAS